MQTQVATTIKRKKRSRVNRRHISLYSMLALPLFLIFVFKYLPIFGIIIAFKDYKFNKGIFGSEWVGLENFTFFLKSNDFIEITWNTLSLNFIFIISGICAALALAILFYSINSRGKVKVFQTVAIMPNFLSWVIVGYMTYAILHPQTGLLNSILITFGIEPIDWYSKAEAWPAILLIASIWKHVGMDSVMYYAGLMGIDSSLFEAAEIDGASRWQIVKYIMFPGLLPLISILTILKVGGIFHADFGLFYQLTRDSGALYSTTDVIDTYVYRMTTQVGDMGISAAIGLLQSLVGFVMVISTNYLSKKIDKDNGLF